MQHFKQTLLFCLALLPFFASPALAVTDTVYVPKYITDTLYVVSPPDTVYIQESEEPQLKEEISTPEKNPYLLEYSTDTIPPGRKFYIGEMTFANLLSIWFGIPILDFSWEIENEYRGSYMFSFSSLMLFGERQIFDSSPTWEGFRSIVSPEFGYRHYLFTFSVGKTNPQKLKVVHRNTPLNSFSFYIQALSGPTFKIAYDKKYKVSTPKKGSFDAGVSASVTLGGDWNSGNMLWDTGITFGYQYWGDKARRFLNGMRDSEGINYHMLNGWSGKGFFLGTDIKLGF